MNTLNALKQTQIMSPHAKGNHYGGASAVGNGPHQGTPESLKQSGPLESDPLSLGGHTHITSGDGSTGGNDRGNRSNGPEKQTDKAKP